MGDLKDKTPILRDEKGHFVKGHCPNPGGKRFKGLAAYIRSQTDDGKELADFAINVLRNPEGVYKHVDQWDAVKWLADRGFGKAVATTVEINGEAVPDLPDLSELTQDELDDLDRTISGIFKRIDKSEK